MDSCQVRLDDLWGSVPTPLSDKEPKAESRRCSAQTQPRQPAELKTASGRLQLPHPPAPPPPSPWPLQGFIPTSLAQSCFADSLLGKELVLAQLLMGRRVGWSGRPVVSALIK